MSNASAPTRGDKVTLSIGLLSIPVQVFNGVDETATKITRNQYSPEGNRVTTVTKDSESGKEYARSELAMKYTTADGTVIDLSDEEIAAAMGVENGDAEVIGVFPLSEFAKYGPAGPAQVRPQTQKVGSKTTHPFDEVFSLFMGALADTERFMLVKYVTRGKPKLIAIFSDGSAQFIHWSNEVREAAPMPVVEVDEKKVALAKALLDQIASDEAPLPMDNEAVQAVHTYAEAKAAGNAPAAKPKAEVKSADDVMALLEASLTVNA